MKYSLEQQNRVKSIVRHVWCRTGELFPKSQGDYFQDHYIRVKIDGGLMKEVNSLYFGAQTKPYLDKCLDIVNLLEQYERDGRPDFGLFPEWYYNQVNNI